MKVLSNSSIFNTQTLNLQNNSVFENILNDMSNSIHSNQTEKREYKKNLLVTKYDDFVKNITPNYVEVNSASFLSMKNSIENEVDFIDIKRVNAVLAYSA